MAKIIGNTIATPYPRPDWEQTDEKKADYIKNKPNIEALESVSYYDKDISPRTPTDPSKLNYSLNSAKTEVTIRGFKDGESEEHLVIPYEIDGARVTRIAAQAFQNSAIKSVSIPRYVKVGVSAFSSTGVGGNIKLRHSGLDAFGAAGAFTYTNIDVIDYSEYVDNTILSNPFACVKERGHTERDTKPHTIIIPNWIDNFYYFEGEYACENLTVVCEQGSYADEYFTNLKAEIPSINVVYNVINVDDMKTQLKIAGESKGNGTEIFNDYGNNYTNIPYAHIEGKNNKANIYGYRINNVGSDNTIYISGGSFFKYDFG